MKNRMLLLASIVVGLLYALPAVASAGVWDIEPETGGFPLKFTATGGPLKLTTSSLTVTCTSHTTEGEYENATTGKITKLVFHGCTGPLGVTCTGTLNANEPAGTTTFTAPMSFHNITLEPSPNTSHKRGILITPKEITNLFTSGLGHFVSYKCAGIETVVAGNGLIGEVTAPECSVFSRTSTTTYASSSTGVQTWQQITTEGTKFDLWSKTGGAAHVTTSLDGDTTVTFERNARQNCT